MGDGHQSRRPEHVDHVRTGNRSMWAGGWSRSVVLKRRVVLSHSLEAGHEKCTQSYTSQASFESFFGGALGHWGLTITG